MKKWMIFCLFFLFIFLAACSNSENMSSDNMNVHVEHDMGIAQMDGAQVDEASRSSYTIPTQAAAIDVDDRKVIYNGNLSLEVKDFSKAEASIEEKVRGMEGYVVDSYYSDHHEDEIFGTMTARVPTENFQLFMDELESEDVKILEKNVTGNDVTEEYIDLQSRLLSKRAVEERLLSFLDEASTTEELLAVSNDLSVVQEEIEQLIGSINYLENHIAYSTIHLQIKEKKTVPPLNDNEPLNTWENGKNLFVQTIHFIITFLSNGAVLIIGLSPIIIPVVIIIFVIFYINKRKKERSTNE